MNKNRGKPQVLRNLFAKYQRCCSKNKNDHGSELFAIYFCRVFSFCGEQLFTINRWVSFWIVLLIQFPDSNLYTEICCFLQFPINANHIWYNENHINIIYIFSLIVVLAKLRPNLLLPRWFGNSPGWCCCTSK